MSDQRTWARRILTEAATEIGAWPERKYDKVFQKALIDIRDDPEVEKIVAQLGGKIPLMPFFVARAEIDAAELAAKQLMHATASIMADQKVLPVSAKEAQEKREDLERALAHALSLAPYDVHNERLRDDYVAWINSYLAIQVALDDPLVERRLPTRKKPGVSDAAHAHARAGWARLQDEARRICGSTGRHVADVFMATVTGIVLSRDDRRVHRPGQRVRRKR
jgi:hypothetical protein